jgi:hypothetical protein
MFEYGCRGELQRSILAPEFRTSQKDFPTLKPRCRLWAHGALLCSRSATDSERIGTERAHLSDEACTACQTQVAPPSCNAEDDPPLCKYWPGTCCPLYAHKQLTPNDFGVSHVLSHFALNAGPFLDGRDSWVVHDYRCSPSHRRVKPLGR